MTRAGAPLPAAAVTAPHLPPPDLALEGPSLAASIDFRTYVQYCEHKLDEYEEERRALLRALEAGRTVERDVQALRWALRRQEDEAQAARHEGAADRRRYLDARADADLLFNENARLRAQEVEDRKRIAELLRLTRPAAERRGGAPEAPAIRPLPAPATIEKYATELLLDTLATARQWESGAERAPDLSAAEAKVLVEFWTQYGKQEERARREAARRHEEAMAEAAAYHKERSDRTEAEAAELREAALAATRALCEYRHHAQIQTRDLRGEVERTRQDLEGRLAQLTAEKDAQERRYLATLEQVKEEDQLHISHLQSAVREQDGRTFEELQSAVGAKRRMAAKVKRIQATVGDLKWRCDQLSQFRFLCLKGHESELHLLTRHLDRLEHLVRQNLLTGGTVALYPDAVAALRALAPDPALLPATPDPHAAHPCRRWRADLVQLSPQLPPPPEDDPLRASPDGELPDRGPAVPPPPPPLRPPRPSIRPKGTHRKIPRT